MRRNGAPCVNHLTVPPPPHPGFMVRWREENARPPGGRGSGGRGRPQRLRRTDLVEVVPPPLAAAPASRCRRPLRR